MLGYLKQSAVYPLTTAAPNHLGDAAPSPTWQFLADWDAISFLKGEVALQPAVSSGFRVSCLPSSNDKLFTINSKDPHHQRSPSAGGPSGK